MCSKSTSSNGKCKIFDCIEVGDDSKVEFN